MNPQEAVGGRIMAGRYAKGNPKFQECRPGLLCNSCRSCGGISHTDSRWFYHWRLRLSRAGEFENGGNLILRPRHIRAFFWGSPRWSAVVMRASWPPNRALYNTFGEDENGNDFLRIIARLIAVGAVYRVEDSGLTWPARFQSSRWHKPWAA